MGVPRPASHLAALADAAVPGLRPIGYAAALASPGDPFQTVHITGRDEKQWTVRVALSAGSGAAMELSDQLLRLLARRLPFAVPHIEGSLTTDDGCFVAVIPRLPGAPALWRDLEPESQHARAVGRAIAQIHTLDPRLIDEAGLPSYDADTYRARRLAALDRAAETGLVPTGLLARWERALEEVSLWKFATRVTHGPLEAAHVYYDEDGVAAITGWEEAALSDPAVDFAPLWALADRGTFDTVLETYAANAPDCADPHLERRIRLVGELQRITALMEAVSGGDQTLIDRRTAALRRLDEATQDDLSLLPPEVAGQRLTVVGDDYAVAQPVDPAQIEVVESAEYPAEDETVEIPLSGPTAADPSGEPPAEQPSSETPSSPVASEQEPRPTYDDAMYDEGDTQPVPQRPRASNE
ncbi:hypothetical protein AZH51_09800 [Branchiibius sp. NY16-3462-2]|nr:hypothetical protein AZH51_09800 [Branchiibius sp. NY16-3462-2]